MSAAIPHQADATANSATPVAKTLRRPYMSPSAPPVRSSAARSSAYDSTTHWTSLSVACRDACIAGNATFTTVPSMNAMLEPRIVAASTQEGLPAPGR
jgi:hypothetical protein